MTVFQVFLIAFELLILLVISLGSSYSKVYLFSLFLSVGVSDCTLTRVHNLFIIALIKYLMLWRGMEIVMNC